MGGAMRVTCSFGQLRAQCSAFSAQVLPGVTFVTGALSAAQCGAPHTADAMGLLMSSTPDLYLPTALPAPAAQLGESPFWHPAESALYWCDIAGRCLNWFHPATGVHRQWRFDSEPCCAAPMLGGAVLLAMRDGLWRFDPATAQRTRLARPPYDMGVERFNDGKADPQGRFWVGTIFEPRSAPKAALYCWDGHTLEREAGGVTVSNGLAFSPDGRALYWADTTSHRVFAFDLSMSTGALSRQRLLAEFPLRGAGQSLQSYGGRPDGAAVDSEGGYWVAMYEGQRLLRLTPEGRVDQEVILPVRCPTMPAFGGDDLRTLFVTTARHNRPPEELSEQPQAGQVFQMRVAVPGLPVNFAK
jgi:sugar lactone lactonase YvrE